MTDTTVAAQAPTPPPTPTETPIPDSSPASPPQPVGSQAPQKSPERIEFERNASRRESIQKAFDKAKQPQQTAKAPDAKPGADKQPQQAQPQQKQPPAQDKAPAQQRGDGGRFVSADPNKQQGQQPAQPVTPQKFQPLAENAPFRDAPGRFSEAAKADWHGVPESVRGATHQMIKQIEDGYQQYRRGAESFQNIADFDDLAQRSGTNLRQALTNYVSMESKLRSDVVGGLDMIINNLGLKDPRTGQRIGLRDVAYHVLSMSPEQLQLNSTRNSSQSQDLKMGQLHQMVESLAQTVQGMQYHQQFTQHRTSIDNFATDHPRFDELADLIKEEVEHGYPLDQAYSRADRLRPDPNPQTRAAQTRNTSAQTRNEVDKSIHGSSPTHAPAAMGKKPIVSRRDAIANAVRKVRGSL